METESLAFVLILLKDYLKVATATLEFLECS